MIFFYVHMHQNFVGKIMDADLRGCLSKHVLV
jgi:hypothetical protein